MTGRGKPFIQIVTFSILAMPEWSVRCWRLFESSIVGEVNSESGLCKSAYSSHWQLQLRIPSRLLKRRCLGREVDLEESHRNRPIPIILHTNISDRLLIRIDAIPTELLNRLFFSMLHSPSENIPSET
jgi:hypothetical protein